MRVFNLPPEIIADVLSQLPVKSLCQFKCVSHSWKTLISSLHFAQTHLNQTKTQKHLDRSNFILIRRFLDLYSVNLTADVPTATKLDFPFLQQSETAPPVSGGTRKGLLFSPLPGSVPPEWVKVRCSCDGLLLVSYDHNSSFFLFNPSTRECKKLPTPPFVVKPVHGRYLYVYGMGYDSNTNDYKVVMLSYYGTGLESEFDCECSTLRSVTYVAVYSLKTNAWRIIEDTHYVLVETNYGVNFYGCLHWFCWRDGSSLMGAFDLANEIFREVPLPASLVDDEIVGNFYRISDE